jgi:hypothetical protein
MKGDLKVVSVLGRGSTFTFSFEAKRCKNNKIGQKRLSTRKKKIATPESIKNISHSIKRKQSTHDELLIIEEVNEPD